MGPREGALVFHQRGFEVFLYTLLRMKADGIVHGALSPPQRRHDCIVTFAQDADKPGGRGVENPQNPVSRGCRRRVTQSSRKAMMSSLFMRNRLIVARPVAVRPRRRIPSVLQAKWADHRCRRGWNKRTRRPVWGSRAWVYRPLQALQARQHKHVLASSVVPPAAAGTI